MVYAENLAEMVGPRPLRKQVDRTDSKHVPPPPTCLLGSVKIDLCLLSKQWIIHLNVSHWSGWVFCCFMAFFLPPHHAPPHPTCAKFIKMPCREAQRTAGRLNREASLGAKLGPARGISGSHFIGNVKGA